MEDRLFEELVRELAGEDVVPLFRLILGKRDVNEFKIADKMGITVNQVRNMLYRLSAHNLVDFTRKKDKRKGWYIYYWTFDLNKAHNLSLMLKKKKLYFLQKRIEKEKIGDYLSCVNECVRFDTANAMEYDFRCPECGELLTREDPEKITAKIEKEISKIKADIEEEEKRIFKEPKKKIERHKIRKKTKKKAKKKIKFKKAGKKKFKKPKLKIKMKKTKKVISKKQLPKKSRFFKHSKPKKRFVKKKIRRIFKKIRKKR